jgi:hypothetical protein
LPLLGRRAAEVPEPTRAQLRVLRADGQRIDLTSKDSVARLAASRQAWSAQAWDYRNMIGELRFSQRLLGISVARVRFYVAAIRPREDPAPLTEDDHGLDSQLAADAVTNFDRLPFDTNPYGFTARLVENLETPGEAFIHIDERDRFWVRSTSELVVTADGKVALKLTPGGGQAGQRLLDMDREEVLRCWQADPEWGELADSPLHAALDICEDVVLAGREERSAARSRLAANGILLIPAGLSLVTTREDEDGDDPAEDTFMADLTEAFLAPVRDDGEPQAVVPIVLRGESEDLDKVRHITVQRAETDKLVERKNAAIMRLLKSLDIQPEQVDGVGSTSHWNAWVIDARSIRDQVEPTAELVAGCLTQAFLRPALIALGHDEDAVERVTIAVDVSPLAENPNRGQDARDAWDRFAISDESLREALGFGDEDKPGEEEFVRRLAAKGALPVDVVARLVGLVKDPGMVVDATPTSRPSLPEGSDARPVARPGETQAESPVPDTKPEPSTNPTAPAITAAVEPDMFRCDPDISRRLADIDAALTERILVASDAALARVVEKAGARVRSAAQKDRTVVASIAGMDAARIPAALGRDRVEAFVPIHDLVTDEHTRLRGQVMAWLGGAARQTGDVVCELLGQSRTSSTHGVVVSRLLADLDGAWAEFAQALADAAEDALFDPGQAALADEPGEKPTGLLAADDVAALLTAAGGSLTAAGKHREKRGRHRLPDDGFATGPVIVKTVAEQGAVLIGREWSWRAELARNAYEPHQDLDGFRFASWSDPELATGAGTDWVGSYFHPGDHRGCLCRAAPLFAIPVDPDAAAGLKRAAGDPRRIPALGRLRDRVMAAVEAMRAQILGRKRR